MVFVLLVLGLFTLGITLTVLAIHALIYNRMPGQLPQKAVHQPRLWGTGFACAAAGQAGHSMAILFVGLGIVAIGHVAKPAD
ncbi:hypothetical protein ACIHCV_45025 [Streptomyces sp. NPDC051956]|uniref:hypothetical protein n=1 Tax=Streptomyces sp. NPDC051956 TaxID=3365677 RepID=UPI0037D91771